MHEYMRAYVHAYLLGCRDAYTYTYTHTHAHTYAILPLIDSFSVNLPTPRGEDMWPLGGKLGF